MLFAIAVFGQHKALWSSRQLQMVICIAVPLIKPITLRAKHIK